MNQLFPSQLLPDVPDACTAERVALRNFKKGVWPPESARLGNPCQEMIGAQAIPGVWRQPLHDNYQTTLNLPIKQVRISEIAQETACYGKRVVASFSGRN